MEREERSPCASDKGESVKAECERIESVGKQLWSTK